MLVIEHRANFLSYPKKSNLGEIDVHLLEDGVFGVKHDIDGHGWELESFLERSNREKFFVDIKQNLPTDVYERLIKIMGDKLIGLFDVPMPAAYFLAKKGVKFYERLSELENPTNLTDRFWLDPLANQVVPHFERLLWETTANQKFIYASPELHGHSFLEASNAWGALKAFVSTENRYAKLEGIVTKYPEEFTKIWADLDEVYIMQ